MTAVLYYLLLKPLSMLPLRVLFVLSDFLYLVAYKLVGYRTKVVRMNMTNSFPEKSPKEIQQLMNQFYSHFCDLIVESLKGFSMSREEAIARCKLMDPEPFEKYYQEGKSVVIVGGHYGNWELLAVAIGAQMNLKVKALYAPLSNKFFDKKMMETRSKYGLILVPKTAATAMFDNLEKEPSFFIFGSDQSPQSPNKKLLWTTFLHQETAVQLGAEKYAKMYNLPVIYGQIDKVKRGYYEFNTSLITATPNELPDLAIMEQYTRMLESGIRAMPQYWLWTHKRWKHKRPVNGKE